MASSLHGISALARHCRRMLLTTRARKLQRNTTALHPTSLVLKLDPWQKREARVCNAVPTDAIQSEVPHTPMCHSDIYFALRRN